MDQQQAKAIHYQCPRCGAETDHEPDVLARYCALCGVSGWEFARIALPAEIRSPDPDPDKHKADSSRSGVHRLPVA